MNGGLIAKVRLKKESHKAVLLAETAMRSTDYLLTGSGRFADLSTADRSNLSPGTPLPQPNPHFPPKPSHFPTHGNHHIRDRLLAARARILHFAHDV